MEPVKEEKIIEKPISKAEKREEVQDDEGGPRPILPDSSLFILSSTNP